MGRHAVARPRNPIEVRGPRAMKLDDDDTEVTVRTPRIHRLEVASIAIGSRGQSRGLSDHLPVLVEISDRRFEVLTT